MYDPRCNNEHSLHILSKRISAYRQMTSQRNLLPRLPVDNGSPDRIGCCCWYRFLTELQDIDLEFREFVPACGVNQRGEWGELDDGHCRDAGWSLR